MALMQIGYIHLCAGEAEPAVAGSPDAPACARTAATSGITPTRSGAWPSPRCCAATTKTPACGAAALRTIRGMDDAMGVVLCLDALAWVAAARREAMRAVTLATAAEAAWAAIPATPTAPLRAHHDAALEVARVASPDAEYRAALTKGSAMTRPRPSRSPWGSPRGRGRTPACRSGSGQLTRRQWDVAALVARGRPTARSRPAWSSRSGRWRPTCSTSWTSSLQHPAQIAAWSAARSR